MELLGSFSFGYVFGSIPFAWFVGKARGVDPRREGSGNVGTGNVGELAGWWWGFLVFVLDAAKALVAVLIAGAWSEAAQIAAAWGVIIGHGWPVWLKFVGGRGQLVTMVAGAVIAPWATLAILPVLGVGALWRPRTSAPGHRAHLAEAWLAALVLYPMLAFWLDGANGGAYAMGALVINVVRRLAGSRQVEHRPFRQAWRSRLIYDADG